jgi:hypothetical protein
MEEWAEGLFAHLQNSRVSLRRTISPSTRIHSLSSTNQHLGMTRILAVNWVTPVRQQEMQVGAHQMM